MPDPILVTGAAGFIGSHLAQRLLADGRAAAIANHLLALPALRMTRNL